MISHVRLRIATIVHFVTVFSVARTAASPTFVSDVSSSATFSLFEESDHEHTAGKRTSRHKIRTKEDTAGKSRTSRQGHTTGRNNVLHQQEDQRSREHQQVQEQLRDVRFQYPPFYLPLPVFLNDTQAGSYWQASEGKQARNLSDHCRKKGFLPPALSAAPPTDESAATDSAATDSAAMGPLVSCSLDTANGWFANEVRIRSGLSVPLTADTCKTLVFDSKNPPPGPSAGTDLLSYDSWSFQHFLDNPALRIAQNLDLYKKYKVQILADLRTHSGAYNNPIVQKMLEKLGLWGQVSAHCSGWTDSDDCTESVQADIAMGCEADTIARTPELVGKFRSLLGVREKLPDEAASDIGAVAGNLLNRDRGRRRARASGILNADWETRLTAADALQHPWIQAHAKGLVCDKKQGTIRSTTTHLRIQED